MKAMIQTEHLSDIEELRNIMDLYQEAEAYITSFGWCKKVDNAWYALGVYEQLGVFLFEIQPANEAIDSMIWVIVGDLPTAYLDSSATTEIEALIIYTDLMEDWARKVLEGESTADGYPVEIEPNEENARALLDKITFIRQEVIPTFE